MGFPYFRDSEGKDFLSGPKFHETDDPFYDTKLTVEGSTAVIPENNEESKRLTTKLKIPLRCLEVRARLYEWEGNVTCSTAFMRNEMIKETAYEKQNCIISYVGNNVSRSDCTDKSNLTTKLSLDVIANEANGMWTAEITWKNLPRTGKTYCLRFGPMLARCEQMNFVKNDDLYKWVPVENEIFHDLGYLAANNEQVASEKADNNVN